MISEPTIENTGEIGVLHDAIYRWPKMGNNVGEFIKRLSISPFVSSKLLGASPQLSLQSTYSMSSAIFSFITCIYSTP